MFKYSPVLILERDPAEDHHGELQDHT